MNRPLEAIVLLCVGLLFVSFGAMAQDTTISYQGQLKQSGTPFTGQADLRFELYDGLVGGAQIGSTQTRLSVPVEDGIFQVELEFGVAAFGEDVRYLELAVDGTVLSPRQPMRPAPLALFALDGNEGPAGPPGPPGPAGPIEPPLFDPRPPPSGLRLFLTSGDVFVGGSGPPGFEDWIPVERFRTAARFDVGTGGGGGGSSTATFDVFSVELASGVWTADLLELLTNGLSSEFQILSCGVGATQPSECFQYFLLRSTYVTRIQPFYSEAADRQLLEIDLDYIQFTWEIRKPQGTTARAFWNRATNSGQFDPAAPGALFSNAGADSIGQLEVAGIAGDLMDGRIAAFDNAQTAVLPGGVVFGGGGPMVPPADILPLAIERRTDAAGPELFFRLVSQAPISSAAFDWTSGTSQGTTSLEQVRVSFMEINSSLREPTEFSANRVHWSVDGTGYGWDVSTNVPWAPPP